MGLKKIHVIVDEEAWEKLLNFVKSKHGKVKGVIGTELSKAIELYVSYNEGGVQGPDQSIYSKYDFAPSKTLKIVSAMADAVVSKFKEGKTVTPNWVQQWVKMNVSPEPRTVSKYMSFFNELYTWDLWDGKYIKPWTFHRRDSKPIWESEKDYLQWLNSRGINTAWIEFQEKKEKESIEEILNAEPI